MQSCHLFVRAGKYESAGRFPKYILLLLFFLVAIRLRADAGLIILSGPEMSGERNIKLKVTYLFAIKGQVSGLRLVTLLPHNIAGRQTIRDGVLSPRPSNIKEIDGNTYAEFTIDESSTNAQVLLDYELTLHGNTFLRETPSAEETKKYLQPEKFIESDSKEITSAAKLLASKNKVTTLLNIYKYVDSILNSTKYDTIDHGARWALLHRSGDCTEYSDLFVALSRACGIPARTVDGLVMDWNKTPRHSWIEALIPELGWVMLDPTPGNHSSFMNSKNDYIYLSRLRNDSVLGGFHDYGYEWLGSGSVDLEVSYEFDQL